ncbi:MAG TPA: DUF4279 domain-containing protein [Candidatus Limnocylindria bacterium]|jgi:hypothetical protein|nr:DUF4279 domain-containing protein [Candidatus Limnocylindria bacterium]
MPTYFADEDGTYTPEKVSARARLVVLSDELLPEELTELLGMAPDKSWRSGEPTTGGRPYRHSGWELASRLPPDRPPEDQLTDLLERLAPIAPAVTSLANNPAVFSVRLSLVRHGENWNPGLSLSLQAIRQMDSLGVGLEIDIYVSEAGKQDLPDVGRPAPPH